MSASVANLWMHEDCMDCLAVRVLPDNNDTVISTTLSGEPSNEHIPAVKKPVSLMRQDYKRPDITILLPWAKGKPLAWDVTVPDTYAESHIANTLSTPGAAADHAAQQKMSKYASLAGTHIFCPIAI